MNEEHAEGNQHPNSLYYKALLICTEITGFFNTEVLKIVKRIPCVLPWRTVVCGLWSVH